MSSEHGTGRSTPKPKQSFSLRPGTPHSQSTKIYSKDERHPLAHLESLQGRTSPELHTSPIKRPVASPSHQMKTSFDFNGNISGGLNEKKTEMSSVYMQDYCSKIPNQTNN